MPCRYPGCVAEAVREDLCVVHAHPDGAKWCDLCHGSGWMAKGMECVDCGGVGIRDSKRSTVVPKRERQPVDQRGLIQESEK